MQIQKRTMGWIQKPSAYQYNQQLNQKRRAMAQNYLNQQTLLSSSIFGAKDNLSYSMTELTLKAVTNRLKAEAEAKIQKGLDEIDETRANLKPKTADAASASVDDDSDDESDSVDKTV
jgi:hypothetical protein